MSCALFEECAEIGRLRKPQLVADLLGRQFREVQHAFGRRGFAKFMAERDQFLPWIAEYSPYALVSKDDPSVYLIYSRPPAIGENQKDPTHTSNFGVKLQEHCIQNVHLHCL